MIHDNKKRVGENAFFPSSPTISKNCGRLSVPSGSAVSHLLRPHVALLSGSATHRRHSRIPIFSTFCMVFLCKWYMAILYRLFDVDI